jgi:flagellar basal body rod protein FlgG
VRPSATRSFIKGKSQRASRFSLRYSTGQIGTSFKTAHDARCHFEPAFLIGLNSSSFNKRRADCIQSLRGSKAMDQLLVSAASGMKARMESLDMLANNIANSGTAGFKSDREFYNLYESQLPNIESQWTDFSQGTLVQTGNPLNVALSGKGMLALNSPAGTVFTRNGDFKISKSNQLETADGFTPRDVLNQGNPITVDPTLPIDILKDGTVQQSGQTVGQLEVDAPDTNPLNLSKLGNSNFVMSKQTTLPPAAQGTDVLQGQLEQSNVPVADSAVKLVGVMRQFEMLQKAISVDTDMSRKGIEEVAKAS